MWFGLLTVKSYFLTQDSNYKRSLPGFETKTASKTAQAQQQARRHVLTLLLISATDHIQTCRKEGMTSFIWCITVAQSIHGVAQHNHRPASISPCALHVTATPQPELQNQSRQPV